MLNLEFVEGEVAHRHIRLDGREEVAHLYIVDGCLHLLLHLSFQFVGVGKQIVDAAKLVDEFCGRLLAHTRAPREVVGRVAHKCQEVDDLRWGSDTVFFLNLTFTDFVVATAVSRPVHIDVRLHELTIVLVGGKHISFYTFGTSFRGHRSDDVVGLESIDL